MKKTKNFFTAIGLTLLMICSYNSSKAQYLSWYQVDMTHPAYALAYSWNSNSDYVRGFCYAWDALGGHSHSYGIARTIEVGGLTINIGETLTPYALSNLLSAGWFYEAAYQLRTNYIPTLTNQDEIDFYNGYANLLEQVSYNPLILEISSGENV
jgi:hypothetical protein